VKKLLLYIILCLILFGLPLIAYTSDEYTGANKCKVCHIKIFKSWEKTPHASAMEVLKPGVKAEAKTKAKLDPAKDYTADLSCLQCHTTGNNQAFPGIQCEACHGAGLKYSAATIMNKSKWAENPEAQRKLAVEAGLVITPGEKACTACHNKKSPTFKPFEYKARLEEVKHPK
jgi:hypothetical protein